MTTTYDFRTGELSGRRICRYCDQLADAATTLPEFTYNPETGEAHTLETWHGSAACVAGDEPSYKMGGPA